ncbi:hypothetical protein JMJ77_0001802 [Colletotrichum scovillei]|uniref:Uncharacterized protein n=1 Tax=Colletotrichum scovillei TaxID=1209932 RepID=A0A9P7R9J4_9PEZI|nr:hypothetical protein JMJ77_0001802 [Colletotrichum scovillei]KAG7070210.1 hypothetical protein JMJ76_0001466 [Colletotrichum scovillei]KAG7078488.1 hypothetical protein JMJ78_0002159 [Colletotrichum scovillei]
MMMLTMLIIYEDEGGLRRRGMGWITHHPKGNATLGNARGKQGKAPRDIKQSTATSRRNAIAKRLSPLVNGR